MFPRVEFPLYTNAEQTSGHARQYLDPRTNAVGTGSFSAAAVGANEALIFRRQGCGANYIIIYSIITSSAIFIQC